MDIEAVNFIDFCPPDVPGKRALTYQLSQPFTSLRGDFLGIAQTFDGALWIKHHRCCKNSPCETPPAHLVHTGDDQRRILRPEALRKSDMALTSGCS